MLGRVSGGFLIELYAAPGIGGEFIMPFAVHLQKSPIAVRGCRTFQAFLCSA
jgi:hypothetical protein